jgi:PAS domain S-box-containing protein
MPMEDLAAFVESSPYAIIVHEPGGHIVLHNEGVRRLLDMSEQQVQALGPFGWVAPEVIRGAPQRLETVLYEGQIRFSSVAKLRNGDEVPTEVHARRVNVESGPLLVALISVTRAAPDTIDG